jgi:hypothetical protein
MARGWESKAIESQQDEAARGRGPRGRRDLSPEERARITERRSLQLARARASAELERATAPAHREMLRHAIADLDRQLGALGE